MNRVVHLLDGNVLIALATPDHSSHGRARAWFRKDLRFATCPITQGSLIRFHMRLAAQPSMANAKRIVERLIALPGHEFWPDDLDYRRVAARNVIGHRQVTDAYLAALAEAHGGVLATLDNGLAAMHPSALLI